MGGGEGEPWGTKGNKGVPPSQLTSRTFTDSSSPPPPRAYPPPAGASRPRSRGARAQAPGESGAQRPQGGPAQPAQPPADPAAQPGGTARGGRRAGSGRRERRLRSAVPGQPPEHSPGPSGSGRLPRCGGRPGSAKASSSPPRAAQAPEHAQCHRQCPLRPRTHAAPLLPVFAAAQGRGRPGRRGRGAHAPDSSPLPRGKGLGQRRDGHEGKNPAWGVFGRGTWGVSRAPHPQPPTPALCPLLSARARRSSAPRTPPGERVPLTPTSPLHGRPCRGPRSLLAGPLAAPHPPANLAPWARLRSRWPPRPGELDSIH
ncbi:uncharacterized protein [Notamacropus eugenii]|uniref:uncharacterized protein n=1 Tax=Notamacropus eugenii TaxID=9315 RepID=UPI003B67F78F